MRAVDPKSILSTYSQLPSVSLVMKKLILLIFLGAAFVAAPTNAGLFSFTTGSPDGKMATASRLDSPGKFEIESADDFVLTSAISVTSATFTGLLPAGATIGEVQVEIYRVFPNDSNVNRTSGPPTFSTSQVPTRVNSPADVAFADRDSGSGKLTFTTALLNTQFTALNSVLNGINPMPNQTTGGEGPITGQEIRFNVDFTTPFLLPKDHYFFIPQVELAGTDNFFWLSATRPLVPPSTVFAPDLQSWIRNANLDPDWLRIGADIVGPNPATAPTFNGAFSVTGLVVPDSGTTAALLGLALAGVAVLRRKLRAS